MKLTNQASSTFKSALQPHRFSNAAQVLELNTNMQEQFLPPLPKRVNNNTPTYSSKETYNKNLEMFIEKVEKELFDPGNIKNVRQNLTRDKRNALAEIKKLENNTVRVQGKGSQYVVLNNDDYVHKVEDHNPTQEFNFKAEKWLEKWIKNKSIDDKWQSYLKPTKDSTPGKMYGLIKTRKVGNPVRVITS